MKKLPDRELLCYSYIAFRPWNHLERPKGYWYHLERAKHHWNARKAIGTCEALLELPEGLLERAKHHWNARRAYF